jgi:hypothetical protein
MINGLEGEGTEVEVFGIKIKTCSKREFAIARLFGKMIATAQDDDGARVTMYWWRGKYYIDQEKVKK